MKAYKSSGDSRHSYDSVSTFRPRGHEPVRTPPTPAELARDAIAGFANEVEMLSGAIAEKQSAYEANDTARWSRSQTTLETRLTAASESKDAARSRAVDAEPSLVDRMQAAESKLDEYKTLAGTMRDAPLGFRPVSRESQIEAALAAPIDSTLTLREGHERKEHQIGSELAQLSVQESYTLAQRFRREQPPAGDRLAQLFSAINDERRLRLLTFLDGARRREALDAARATGGKQLATPTRAEASAGQQSPTTSEHAEQRHPVTEGPQLQAEPSPHQQSSARNERAEQAEPRTDESTPQAEAPTVSSPEPSAQDLAPTGPPADMPDDDSGALGPRLAAAVGAHYLGTGVFALPRSGRRVEVRRTHRAAPDVRRVAGPQNTTEAAAPKSEPPKPEPQRIAPAAASPSSELFVLELPRGLAGVDFERALTSEFERLDAEGSANAHTDGVDPANAEAMHGEAAPIAQALGLGTPPLDVGAEAAAVTGARGARGIALEDVTFVDPALNAGDRREVLAHELVHQAQAKLPASADRGRDAAEAEAHAIASRYAATGELAQPQLAIDLSQAAADTDARKPGVTAAMYLHLHASQFLRASRERVTGISPALPSGLGWHEYPRFAELFLRAFTARIDGFALDKAGALQEIVYPANVYDAIDGARIMLGFDKAAAAQHPGDPRYGQLGLREWSAPAGAAFAHVIEAALRQSVARMAGRYLETAQRKGLSGGTVDNPWSPVEANELVMSHPMDGLVTPALPAFGVVEIKSQPRRAKASAATGKRTNGTAHESAASDETPRTKNGLRALDLETVEWQGARDPALWNWVKVAEPDATTEEVAEAFFGTGSGEGSTYSYGITAMPPYFGLPKRWARNLAIPSKHAPTDAARDEQPHDNAIAFASSSLADDAALQQAGGADPSGKQLGEAEIRELLKQSAAQVAHIDPIITAWGERSQLAGARAFLADSERSLDADPAQARKRGAVVRRQQEVLYEVATQLDQLHSQIGSSGKLDPADPQLAPYRDVVAAYARAAATSHLAVTSRGLLAAAREQQRMLIARVVADAARNTELTAEGMRSANGKGDAEQRDLSAQSAAVAASAAQFQRDALAGKAPDPDQADELLVTADEVAFKARNRMFADMLASVAKSAEAVNNGVVAKVANSIDTDIYTLPHRAVGLAAKLRTISAHHDTMNAHVRLLALQQPNEAKMIREGRRRALANARIEMADIEKDQTVKKFLDDAYREIDDAQTRTLILQVALMIGLALVSAGIGNAATAAMRGFVVGRSAQAVSATVALSRSALVATRVGGMVIESAANTAAQHVILNKPVGEAFLGDFLSNLATAGILHGLRSGADAANVADDAIRAIWKQSRGKLVLTKTLQITGETLVGAATSYVIERATHSGKLEPQTVTQWYLQGASIAVGRFLHGALAKQLQRVQALAAVKGWDRGRAFTHEVRALKAAAANHEAHPTHDGALALIKQRGQLLQKEHYLLNDLAANPKLAQQLDGGLALKQAENTAALVEHSGPGTRRLILEGAGLRPTIGEHTWSGTSDEIAKAMANAQNAGMAVRDKGKQGDIKTLQIGDTEIRIHETRTASRIVVLAGDDVDLLAVAQAIQPEPGKLDVLVHGEIDNLLIVRGGHKIPIDHRALATYIRKSGQPFKAIRLLACKAGQHPKGVAQHLANKLGVPVLAPSDTLWASEDGTLIIGPKPDRKTGRWLPFEPQKSELRYSKPRGRDRPPPTSTEQQLTEQQQPAERASREVGDARDSTQKPVHESEANTSASSTAGDQGGVPNAAQHHNYHLSGDDGGVLTLSSTRPEQWADDIASFLANELHVRRSDLTIKVLHNPQDGEGRSGDPVFGVKLNGEDLGVFKIFKERAASVTEIQMLKLLQQKKMKHFDVVGGMGTAQVSIDGRQKGAMMMETAVGESVNRQIGAVPRPGQTGHDEGVARLTQSVRSVARALAELHANFASGNEVAVTQKHEDAQYILSKLRRNRPAMAAADYEFIETQFTQRTLPEFIKSSIPATAYHGDANAGNFMIDANDRVRVIDVGSMRHSLDTHDRGKGAGAADVGRFAQSLEASSGERLTAPELAALQQSFLDAYFAASHQDRSSFAPAIRLYRAELEIAAIEFAKSPSEATAAVTRLAGVLGIDLPPRKAAP